MKHQNRILSKLTFKKILAIIIFHLPCANAMEVKIQNEIPVGGDSSHQVLSTKCHMENVSIVPNYFRGSVLNTLNILTLTDCTFEQAKDMDFFLQGLAKNKSITSLSLINMLEFQQQGFQYLVNALKSNVTLLSLDLSKNYITCKNVDYLAHLLGSNKTITFLNLSDNSILNKGAIIISEALLENRTLTSLNLQTNEIGKYESGDKGMIALGEVILKNKTLKALNLKGNMVGKNGAIVLKYMLLKNDTLERFNLNDKFVLDKEQLHPSQRLQIMKDYTKYYWAENNLYAKMAVSVAACYVIGLTFCSQLCEQQFCWEFSRQMLLAFGGFFLCYYLENLADF